MKKKLLFFIVFIVLCLALFNVLKIYNSEEIKEFSKTIFAMDTILEFKIYGNSDAKEALDKAVSRVREIEDRMSATKENSDVAKINQNAGKQPVKVHDDTFYVIEKALEYAKLTNGDFDITVRPIIDLWGILSDNPIIPDKDEIENKLALVDYRKVKLDEKNKTVYLEKEGMGIDLGAIAKGYAGDEVARILKEAGVKSALINLGGNVLVIGRKPDNKLWRIGIKDPRSEETGKVHVGVLEVEDVAIVSSGDYERYMVDVYEKTGIRYHHIFDPDTGAPARSGLMACTIVAQNSMDADALSTSFFIKGKDEGFKLIEGIKDVEAIAITEDKEIYVSKGLSNRVTEWSEDYEIKQ